MIYCCVLLLLLSPFGALMQDKHDLSVNKKCLFSSEFKGAATLKQLRKGCDGRPGTVGQLDACGKCQGDNSTCTDCAGVVNGDAIIGRIFDSTLWNFILLSSKREAGGILSFFKTYSPND